MNIHIKNKADRSATIDLFGGIGEDWFGEGITMQSVKSQIESLDVDNITLNISSLGGDANHGLAIHDILKTHNAYITAKIIGATASAGTLVALGADKVEVSENALFLAHKASSLAWGNANEMRKTAEDLDRFDSRIINIYKKKTGKSKKAIEDLMDQDKWITAEEAMEFGFVDSVFKPSKALNKADIESLVNSKLPKLPENFTNKIDMDTKTITDKLEAWGNKILAKFENKEEKAVDYKEVVNAAKAEIENEFKTSIETLNTEKSALETKVNDLTTASASKDAELETLKGELAKARLGNVEDGGASNDSPEDSKPQTASVFDAIAKQIKNVHHV